MKKIILLFVLFFSVSLYGQIDTISVAKSSNLSVVSADKIKVVYRGLPNPISIHLTDNIPFTASAPGLSKDEKGNYFLNPGPGTEVFVTVVYKKNDGKSVAERHRFRIKNLPYLSGAINGLTCNQSVILMSKKELEKAKLSISFSEDFLYELKFNLESFAVKIGEKFIYISGDHLNKEALDLIEKLPLNAVFEIVNFKSDIRCNNCNISPISPLKIMIVEDDNYTEDEE